MEVLVVFETIEEAREKIIDLKKSGQYGWDIYECSEIPKLWVETPEAKAARLAAHEAYMQKHGSFVETLEKRVAMNEKTNFNDRENSVRTFWGIE